MDYSKGPLLVCNLFHDFQWEFVVSVAISAVISDKPE